LRITRKPRPVRLRSDYLIAAVCRCGCAG